MKLAGKVTIPAEYNGIPVVSIGDFRNTINITHVFFLDGANGSYIRIEDNSFGVQDDAYLRNISLTGVYIPHSIIYIGGQAFYNHYKLKDFAWHDNITYIGSSAFSVQRFINYGYGILEMNELPAGLKTLGANAFYGNSDHLTITKLPNNLTKIEDWVFYKGNDVTISEFGNSLMHIGKSAFAYGGSNISSDTVYFKSSVTHIGAEAFGKLSNGGTSIYGNGRIKHLYFENPYTVYENALVTSDKRAIYDALSDAEKEA